MGTPWLEVVGWVGSAILVWSLLQTQLRRLRVINLVGCVVLIVYNTVNHVWPMVGPQRRPRRHQRLLPRADVPGEA